MLADHPPAEELEQSPMQVGVDKLTKEIVSRRPPQLAAVNIGVSAMPSKICRNGSVKPLEELGRAQAEAATSDVSAAD